MEIGQRSASLALFAQRLACRSPISNEERVDLMALPGSSLHVSAHYDFVRLGEDVQYVSLISEGIVSRFAQLDDGSRQISGFYIPGDMVDLYSMVLPRAPSPLQAMTNCVIVKIPHHALRNLAQRHHTLCSALWRDCVVDGHVVAQWLVNVGRKDARARMAHLICEMAVRFAQIGRLHNGAFPFRITQEQLADALGLTSVHVNRSLRALREEGLMRMTRSEAIVMNWDRLRSVGEFNADYLHLPARGNRAPAGMAPPGPAHPGVSHAATAMGRSGPSHSYAA